MALIWFNEHIIGAILVSLMAAFFPYVNFLERVNTKRVEDVPPITRSPQLRVKEKVAKLTTVDSDPFRKIHIPLRRIRQIMQEELNLLRAVQEYDSRKSRELAMKLSESIKRRVKSLNLSRYRIISTVFIGNDNNQSVNIASKALWNSSIDIHESCVFSEKQMYAVAIVFLIQKEWYKVVFYFAYWLNNCFSFSPHISFIADSWLILTIVLIWFYPNCLTSDVTSDDVIRSRTNWFTFFKYIQINLLEWTETLLWLVIFFELKPRKKEIELNLLLLTLNSTSLKGLWPE